MSEADDIKRELWRLGLMLTGCEEGANASLLSVLAIQENVRKLSDVRRRRLLINGARRWFGRTPRDVQRESELTQMMRSMESLPRAAWVLRDVQGLDAVPAAQILGLNRESTERYADQARAKLRTALAHPQVSAAEMLRAAALNADPGPAMAKVDQAVRGARLRRRCITLLQVLLLFGTLALVAWIGTDLMRANQAEKEVRTLQDQVSNPIPDEEARDRRARERRDGATEGQP